MKVLLFSVAPVAINDINVGKNGFSWISSTLRIIQNWDNVEIFIKKFFGFSTQKGMRNGYTKRSLACVARNLLNPNRSLEKQFCICLIYKYLLTLPQKKEYTPMRNCDIKFVNKEITAQLHKSVAI